MFVKERETIFILLEKVSFFQESGSKLEITNTVTFENNVKVGSKSTLTVVGFPLKKATLLGNEQLTLHGSSDGKLVGITVRRIFLLVFFKPRIMFFFTCIFQVGSKWNNGQETCDVWGRNLSNNIHPGAKGCTSVKIWKRGTPHPNGYQDWVPTTHIPANILNAHSLNVV